MAQGTLNCNLNLKCTASGCENVKQLVLPVSCSTVADLKGLIEKQYSIPSCVQRLTFHNVPLSDTDSFCPAYISENEMLSVLYPSEANISDVAQVVQWLEKVNAAIQNQSLLDSEIPHLIGQVDVISNLTVNLFFPWDAGMKYVNKLYFDDCGGLAILCSVYGFLVKLDWKKMSDALKYLELICVQSIVNFSQTFELRRRVIHLGGLDMCITTLLRHKYVGRTEILNLSPSTTSAIELGFYAICNLAELPEYQLVIAKNSDIIKQIMHVLKSWGFSCKLAVVAISIITCIAQSVDTHPYLLTKGVFIGLLEAAQYREQISVSAREIHEMNAFRCYVAATLAMMIIPSSPKHLEVIDPTRICRPMMQAVLSNVTPRMLQTYEDQEGLMWCSLYPFIRLFYLPTLHSCLEDPSLKQEYVLSVKVLILMLHGTLSRKVHFDILCKEQMLDYIAVLPWILPGELSQAASDLISDLSSHKPLQPPTLVNIVKARLASWQLGLNAVRNTSVRDIVDVIFSL